MDKWTTETEFMDDILLLSEFYISNKTPIPPKLNVTTQENSKKALISKPWYESDSDEELDGNINQMGTPDPAGETTENNLQLMNNIRMQVRHVVGDRYNNDIVEKFYKVLQDKNSTAKSTVSRTPKNISVPNIKDIKIETKTSGKQNLTSELTINSSNASESSQSEQKQSKNKHKNSKKNFRNPSRYYSNKPFTSNDDFDCASKDEFPPLS